MKIIFLDIDGVLNVYPQGRDEYGAKFHPHFETNLKRIIDETGAKIVVSSTWRASGLQNMQDMWRDRGLAGEVIDITPSFRNTRENFIRGEEIDAWLEKANDHYNITRYCIIDDDTDFLLYQMPNFVRTSQNKDHEDCIDIGYGLTSKCTDKVIEILNKTWK